MDKHLKFSSQKEAELVLFDKVDDVLVPKFDFIADVVGIIHKKTGKVLKLEEELILETNPILGWHVNVRGVGVDDFVEYEVTVNTPHRAWL